MLDLRVTDRDVAAEGREAGSFEVRAGVVELFRVVVNEVHPRRPDVAIAFNGSPGDSSDRVLEALRQRRDRWDNSRGGAARRGSRVHHLANAKPSASLEHSLRVSLGVITHLRPQVK